MTEIDCRMARANGLRPEQYIRGFVRRDEEDVLLATDEEWNGVVRLDPESARFLGMRLVQWADEVSRAQQMVRR